MPLNKKGKKIMKAMKEQYGKKKAKQIFYASKNKGKIKNVEKLRYGGGADMGAPERASQRSERGYGGVGKGTGGRQPQAQYQGAKPSEKARQAMQAQRERARGRISPSTTLAGKAAAAGIATALGVPFLGYKFGKRMVDYSPMAFGVPKGRKRKDVTPIDRDGPETMIAQQPILPVPVTPIEQIRRAYKKPTVSSTGEFGYSVGLKKGGMLRQGKPKLAKKGWK